MWRYHGLRQVFVLVGGITIASCAQYVVRPRSPESASSTNSPSTSSPLTSSPLTSSPSTSSPIASPPTEPLLAADPNGDYGRTDHQVWQVVDSDPNGLNCRWSASMPTDWYSPDAQFPNQNFGQWQVVRQFPEGTTLTANLAPAGFALLYDDQQKPWLKVSIGENEQICLVRANAAYVRPIAE
ncbi:MAG: hypothetical protein Kow00121_54180 [Elainellaceae cyanobacterium]